MALVESFFFVFAASFTIGLSGAMSPGPLTVFVIGQSVRHGALAGPLAALGHGLLELALVVLLWLGLARIFQWDPVLAAIAIVGGCVMVWMGWQLVNEARRQGPALLQATVEQPSSSPFVGGAVLSLVNPYWALWWATVGISTMTTLAVPRGLSGLAAFGFGHVASDFLWLTLISIIVATGRRILTARTYLWALYTFGLLLALFGVYFIFNGVSTAINSFA